MTGGRNPAGMLCKLTCVMPVFTDKQDDPCTIEKKILVHF